MRAELSLASAERSAASASSKPFCEPTARFEQRLRPLVGLPRIDDGGLVLRHGGALQIGIQRKQRRADLDTVAFAHRQGFQPTRLLGADENELGLDPALKFKLRPLTAPVLKGGKGEADHGQARARRTSACAARSWCVLSGEQIAVGAEQPGNVERLDLGE